MRFVVPLLILLSTTLASSTRESPPDVVNKDVVLKSVERSIDVSSPVVRSAAKLIVENRGKQNNVNGIHFALEPELHAHVAWKKARQLVSGEYEAVALVNAKVKGMEGKPAWFIFFSEPLKPGQSTKVELEFHLTHVLRPFPTHITQRDRQLVVYEDDSHYLFSPYLCESQTTKVVVPAGGTLENYSKLKPASHSEGSVSYGPYRNVEPLSQDKMTIHFENNNPFLTVRRLVRTVEVSHWGNIAIEEFIEIHHIGAKLTGSFSRYDYQREAHSGVSSVRSFRTVLPAAAKDVYYRDEIGNISTSNLKVMDDAVEVDLRPRFPLFGGWKTEYTLGYNVPSYEYLYNNGDDYILKMRLLDHIYDDMAVDHLTLHIILPEGSSNIKLIPPYHVKRLPNSLHYTYLDTTGRPVISMERTNLVEAHVADFKLEYHFPRIYMLQEPLLVVLAFYLLFLAVIVYVRLDFSITKDDASESKLRAAGCRDRLLAQQDRRATVYRSLDDHLARLKSTKDTAAYQVALKTITLDHKAATASVAEIATKLKSEQSTGARQNDTLPADKIADLQKLDRNLWEAYNQHGQFVEKLVSGRFGKQQFVDAENQVNRRKEEIVEKINAIVKSL